MALATYTDMENRLGITLSDQADQDRAEALLEQASALVMEEAGDVAEGDAPILASIITVEVVVRVWINPSSVQSESMGATSASYGPGLGLLLTDDEKSQLRRAFGLGSTSYTLQLN